MQKDQQNSNRETDLMEDYIESLKVRRYSPKTIHAYRKAIQKFLRTMAHRQLRDITGRDMKDYRAMLLDSGLKTSSVHFYSRAVKVFFDYLVATQKLFASPIAGIEPIKVTQAIQPIPTEEEMQILLNAPNTDTPKGIRDRAILETLYSAGLRCDELVRMTVSCLDLKEGKARIMGKGKRERMVPLGTEAVRRLNDYLQKVRKTRAWAASGDSLWIAMNGLPFGSAGVQILPYRYCKASGISTRISPHGIRRACATHMLRRGAPAVSIQMLLGHADMSHLKSYLKVAMTDLKKAHEESRLGQ